MLIVLFVLSLIVISLLLWSIFEKNRSGICLSRKRLEGKTVIVTGGTTGMGLVIATDLADRGARVIIACPFEDEGIQARNQIIQETENEKVFFKLLDLSSLKSTRKFASDILNSEERLDILVNNAGVSGPAECMTKDGMNFVMQVNYYGQFLLTLLLLPLLKKTGKPRESSRILTTASFLHRCAQVGVKGANQHTNIFKSYGTSKMFLIYFGTELTRRLRGTNVVINTVGPGAVGTTIFNGLNPIIGRICTQFCLIFCQTPWFGAQTALHVALDKSAGEVSGEYFERCKISRAINRAYCHETEKELWEDSIRFVKMTNEEVNQCFQSLYKLRN